MENMSNDLQRFRTGAIVRIVYGGKGEITATWIETLKNPLWPICGKETRQIRYYLVQGAFGSACYRNDELEKTL